MLAALTVRDIVLIEQAALEFAPGLNVLTGETGAGKSILLDALGLAAGGRGGGRAGVRPGAAQGSATAVFEPAADHAARALLREQAMPAEGEIVLRRTLAADGHTRAFVNDEAVGVALLKDLGGMLLEVHGQTDDRGLFDVATHRGLLDAFGGHEALAREVAARFARTGCGAQGRWRSCRRAAAEAAADADYVRAALDELSSLAPEEGEEERAGRRARADDERRPHRRGCRAAPESLSRRARRGNRAGRGAEETVAHERRGAQARRRRGSRAGTGLRPDRRGAARTGCACCRAWTPTPPRWSARKSGCSRCAPLARKYGVHARCACRACWPISQAKQRRPRTAATRASRRRGSGGAPRATLISTRRAEAVEGPRSRRASSWKPRSPANWRR